MFSLLLFAAVLASYSSIIHNQFLDYDDNEYITNNAHVKAGLTWANVQWAFSTSEEANWHPLTWLSHELDSELFGLNPVGHHVVNVLLHAVNAVLLFLLLQSATGFRWRSLMVAALFALHPINVESVAWAAERKNVLSMLFFLLALYAYGRYARRSGLGRYIAVAGFFVLSLLAKPQAITFPFLLLLWDYWPLDRIGARDMPTQAGNAPRLPIARLLLEKLPLLFLSAASAVITMEAQKAGGAVKDLARFSLPLRLETTVISYARYLGKTFWPTKLVLPYPHPLKLYPSWQVGAAVALLLLITAIVLCARDKRYLAVGWFWFLGSLVPMIGLVQVGEQAMADRYAYIPFLGLFLMIVWLIADWTAAWNRTRQIPARWLAIPAVCCLLALASLTYRQVGYLHDTEALWRRALALTQDNYIAQGALAGVLHKQGKTEEAIEHIRAALAIRPDDWPANLILAAYEQSQGDTAAATARYQMVALRASKPSQRAAAYNDLGTAYRQTGDLLRAKEAFEQSLRLVPSQPMLMVTLGLIAQKNGDLPEAVRQYSSAFELQHSDVRALLLAQALRLEGRVDEANAMSRRAARASGNLAEAQKTVDSLLAGK
ncbi:MAG: tetratricopeptide repeat protein [Terriglobales bacterium]